MKDVGSYDGWPADGGPAALDMLVGAIRNLLTQTHLVDPKDGIGDDLRSFYKGPDLPETAATFSLYTRLSPEMVEFDREDQGRDQLDLIIETALRLGIEQGYRIALREHDVILPTMGTELLLMSLTRIVEEQAKRGDKRHVGLTGAGVALREAIIHLRASSSSSSRTS